MGFRHDQYVEGKGALIANKKDSRCPGVKGPSVSLLAEKMKKLRVETDNERPPDAHKTFAFNVIVTGVYCTIIFVQSSFPAPETLPAFPFSDKLLHFLAYAFLGMLFYRTFESSPYRINIQVVILTAMAASTLYGISDEIHQYFVPQREADVVDGIMDGLGSIFGVLVYHSVSKKYPIWSMPINGRKKGIDWDKKMPTP